MPSPAESRMGSTSEKESANTAGPAPVPKLSRSETLEHDAKVEVHFQGLNDIPCMPWAAPTPGQTAFPSLTSLPEIPEDAGAPRTPLPPGWKIHIHPNGSIYYFNEAYKLTSNFELRNTAASHDRFLELLRDTPAYDEREDHWEVNLTRRGHVSGYIWIDHTKMSASELNQHPTLFSEDIEKDDITSKLAREERYWTYIQGHPNHVKRLPTSVWQEAYEALSWCYADRLLFKHTNATFSKDDSKDLLEMLERLKGGDSVALRNWILASVLRAIAADRQGTHYGQHDAPKVREREVDDIVGNYESRSLPMELAYYGLGVFMFLGIPHTYFRRIQDVDRTRFKDGVNSLRWKAFIQALLKEWSDSNLLATVLISSMHAASLLKRWVTSLYSRVRGQSMTAHPSENRQLYRSSI